MVQLETALMNDLHGGYVATCSTMPGCFGRGGTRDEAIEDLKRSIVEKLERTMPLTTRDVMLNVREQSPCGAAWPMAA